MEQSYELRSKDRYKDAEDDLESLPPPNPISSSSSSSEEDVGEFDPLNYDAGTLKRKKKRRRNGIADGEAGSNSRRPRKRRWFVPSRFCCFLISLFFGCLFLLLSAGGIWVYKSAPKDGDSPPWYPTPLGGTEKSWEESYKKAADLVRQMTLMEKVNITTGIGWQMGMCVGNTGPVPRLGFPSLCLQDGPLGIRFADNITAFPAGITVGATWNKDLMYKRGRAHGLEARLKGVNVLLGPAMGPLGRSPYGGRNWEGFGTDPVLQGIAAAQTIKGIQDEGVIATAKHWLANEQEHFRRPWEWATPNAISSNVDDRTLHELYAWPFAESVRAGVASVMCSYNQVNNSYACQNSKLMNGVLKDELGFQGFVQSDWLGQRSGVASALAGLDMTMPGDGLGWMDGSSLWGPKLTTAVLNGTVPMQRMNDMVTRIVAAWYQLGQDDKQTWPDGAPNFSSWTDEEKGLLHPGSNDKTTGVVNKFKNVQGEGDNFHGNLARKIAVEGMVLVKNDDNVLPLSRQGWPVDEKKDNKYRVGIYGEDSILDKKGINACPDRQCNRGTLASGWGSGAVEFPYLISPMDALTKAFNQDSVEIASHPTNTVRKKKIPEWTHSQDLCLVFVNSDAGEGYAKVDGIAGDRNTLRTQRGGENLVRDVGNNCGKGAGKTIVVIHAVGPVLVENYVDLPTVKAIVYAHLPGQESGNALVDVLFGDVNPSGRLPYTVAKDEKDYGPGAPILRMPNGLAPQANFSEGMYIDYRHFDKENISPRYEFGFGLSYTTFNVSKILIESKNRERSLLPSPRPDRPSVIPPKYRPVLPDPKTALFPTPFRKLKHYIYPYISSLKVVEPGKPYPYPPGVDEPTPFSQAGGAQGGNPDLYTTLVEVSASVVNTGSRPGSSVVQLYISYPSGYTDPETGDAIDFPVKALRGFEKTAMLEEDKSERVKFELTRKDLSYWDTKRQNWVLPQGEFKVHVGFSSRDLPLSGTLA